jgi:hypothetical protein
LCQDISEIDLQSTPRPIKGFVCGQFANRAQQPQPTAAKCSTVEEKYATNYIGLELLKHGETVQDDLKSVVRKDVRVRLPASAQSFQ